MSGWIWEVSDKMALQAAPSCQIWCKGDQKLNQLLEPCDVQDVPISAGHRKWRCPDKALAQDKCWENTENDCEKQHFLSKDATHPLTSRPLHPAQNKLLMSRMWYLPDLPKGSSSGGRWAILRLSFPCIASALNMILQLFRAERHFSPSAVAVPTETKHFHVGWREWVHFQISSNDRPHGN
jgi:hypothetical protein